MANVKPRIFERLSAEEKTMCRSLATSDSPITFDQVAMQIWFLGKGYPVTRNQFVVLQILWRTFLSSKMGLPESAFQGRPTHSPSLTGFKNEHGLDALPPDSRVRNSFKRSPLWGFLVVRNKLRRLALNLPNLGANDETVMPPDIESLIRQRASVQPFAKKNRKSRVKTKR